MSPRRKGLLLSLFFFATAAKAWADPRADERDFELSLRLMATGQASRAVPILNGLYIATHAPRIRLELGRALLFSGRLRDARAVFVQAYEDNPPPEVKVTILHFIDQIDRLRGKLRLDISVSRFANPLQQPSSYDVYFGGYVLQLQTDSKLRNVIGVDYSMKYVINLPYRFDVDIYGGYTDLYRRVEDNWRFEASIGKSLKVEPIQLRIGVQDYEMENQTYRLPFGAFIYQYRINSRLEFTPKAQIGYWSSGISRGLSGMNYQLSAPLSYIGSPAAAVSFGPRVEFHNALYAEQSYSSIGIGAGATWSNRLINLDASVFPRITKFNAIDPFWQTTRLDRSLNGAVEISSDRVRYKGLMPTLGMFCSLNRSNISYYNQNHCDITIGIRQIF